MFIFQETLFLRSFKYTLNVHKICNSIYNFSFTPLILLLLLPKIHNMIMRNVFPSHLSLLLYGVYMSSSALFSINHKINVFNYDICMYDFFFSFYIIKFHRSIDSHFHKISIYSSLYSQYKHFIAEGLHFVNFSPF